MHDRAGDVVFGVRWGPGVGQARRTSMAWMCLFFLYVNTWMSRACTSSSLCRENAFGCEQTALNASPWRQNSLEEVCQAPGWLIGLLPFLSSGPIMLGSLWLLLPTFTPCWPMRWGVLASGALVQVV